jgi:hypothetical protein
MDQIEPQIIKKAGMTFRYDRTQRFELGNLQCFGQRLEQLDYMDLDSMQVKIDELHLWAEAPVIAQRNLDAYIASGMAFTDAVQTAKLSDAKEIYDATTGEHLNTPSGKYNLCQNKDLFQAVHDVCMEKGIQPMGRIDVGDKGFTTGYSILSNPEYEITLLEQYDEPIMLMPELRNSPAGQMGVTYTLDGIMGVCSNFCVWGLPMLKTSMKHSADDVTKMPEFIETHLKNLVANTPKLTKLCSDAESIPVDAKDIEPLLWGCSKPKGLSIKTIDAIVENPARFNARLTDASPIGQKVELSQFQLWNCVTNNLTFKGTNSVQSMLAEFEAANELLTKSQDKLIEIGTQRIKSYAEQLMKQKEKNANKKAERIVEVTLAQ